MTDHRRIHEIRILASILLKSSTQAIEKRMSEKGITLSVLQLNILRLLTIETFTNSELSRKMMLDPSTLVPSVDALVKRGYVVRHRDPNDRRRHPLSLTENGRHILHDLHIITDDDPLHQALAGLQAEDVHQLVDLLRAVVRGLPDGEHILDEVQLRLTTHDEQRHKLADDQ